MNPNDNDPEGRNEEPIQPSPPGARVLSSTDLMGGEREIWIEHGQEMYRLRLTNSDKLILMK